MVLGNQMKIMKILLIIQIYKIVKSTTIENGIKRALQQEILVLNKLVTR